MLSGGGGLAQIGVDDAHILRPPAELDGAVGERVLRAPALLMGEHLVRTGLANIDQGLARQVLRSDEFGGRHRSPRRRWTTLVKDVLLEIGRQVREICTPGSDRGGGEATPHPYRILGAAMNNIQASTWATTRPCSTAVTRAA